MAFQYGDPVNVEINGQTYPGTYAGRSNSEPGKYTVTLSNGNHRVLPNQVSKREGQSSSNRVPTRSSRHRGSDSGSSGETPNTLFRSLRGDEQPFEDGLRPPKNADPSKSISEHVTSGSRSKVKSVYVSTTSSKRRAVAWAAKYGSGQFAEVLKTGYEANLSHRDGATLYVKSNIGINSAVASKEFVLSFGYSVEAVKAVYDVQKVSADRANAINNAISANQGNSVRCEHTGKQIVGAQVSRANKTSGGKPVPPHGAIIFAPTLNPIYEKARKEKIRR